MRASRRAASPCRVPRSTSTRRKARPWWSSKARRVDPLSWSENEQQREVAMFWKTMIAVILAVATAFVFKSVSATVAVFVLAMLVVVVIEGVRIVPQQSAWVVERLGKFSRILEP